MGWLLFLGWLLFFGCSILLGLGLGWVLGELNKTVTGEDQ